MYIKTFLNCAALSLGLISSVGAMKYGSPFQLKVEAFVNQMAFPGMDVQFPAGNHMAEQDLHQQIYNSSKKAYGDALKTGLVHSFYTKEGCFDELFHNAIEYFPKFLFYQGKGLEKYEENDLKILRLFLPEQKIVDGAVMVTGDYKNPARNKEIFFRVQVLQHNS
jgi:hypothetical protein